MEVTGIQIDQSAVKALARHEAVQAAIQEAAEQGRAFARSIAPVDTGRYRDSIETRRRGEEAEIVSTVHYAVYLEYGTRHMEGQHIFGRTLDAMIKSGGMS